MSSRRRDGGPFPWRVHPIWRGIGCLLLILVPVIAFGLAEMLLDFAPSRSEFLANYLADMADGPEIFYIKLGLTVVLSVILFLLFQIVGSLIYSLGGGPQDEDLASRTKRPPYRR